MGKMKKGGRKKSWLKKLGTLLSFGALVAAVVKEMSTPSEDRTGHGVVLGAVPYDFRMPSFERVKERLWNPDGSLFSPQVFGVGWTMNLGAAVHKLKALRQST